MRARLIRRRDGLPDFYVISDSQEMLIEWKRLRKFLSSISRDMDSIAEDLAVRKRETEDFMRDMDQKMSKTKLVIAKHTSFTENALN
jgi:hypothetical protein